MNELEKWNNVFSRFSWNEKTYVIHHWQWLNFTCKFVKIFNQA